MTEVFSVIELQSGLLATIDVPDRKDIYCVACNSVVDKVPDTANKYAPDTRHTSALIFGADARLL